MPKSEPATGQVVIAAYRPKPGKSGELEAILSSHVRTLRAEGLATARPVTLLRSFADGTYLEIFEWASGAAAQRAHETPAVAALWDAMAAVADFVPLAELAETRRPFPHFAPVDGVTS